METVEMRMNIVEPSADHLTLEEAVQLVGLGDKTLRRALQAGELPRRYVVGARGPHLVFLRSDVEQWMRRRAPRLGARGRRANGHREATELMSPAAHSWAQSLATIAQLQAALEESRSVMAALMARLNQQSAAMVEAQLTIAHLAARLAELDSATHKDVPREPAAVLKPSLS
jgi:predicted DNA-binding transcriptional regulator AlpA